MTTCGSINNVNRWRSLKLITPAWKLIVGAFNSWHDRLIMALQFLLIIVFSSPFNASFAPLPFKTNRYAHYFFQQCFKYIVIIFQFIDDWTHLFRSFVLGKSIYNFFSIIPIPNLNAFIVTEMLSVTLVTLISIRLWPIIHNTAWLPPEMISFIPWIDWMTINIINGNHKNGVVFNGKKEVVTPPFAVRFIAESLPWIN